MVASPTKEITMSTRFIAPNKQLRDTAVMRFNLLMNRVLGSNQFRQGWFVLVDNPGYVAVYVGINSLGTDRESVSFSGEDRQAMVIELRDMLHEAGYDVTAIRNDMKDRTLIEFNPL
jgi:hypothetical protein